MTSAFLSESLAEQSAALGVRRVAYLTVFIVTFVFSGPIRSNNEQAVDDLQITEARLTARLPFLRSTVALGPRCGCGRSGVK